MAFQSSRKYSVPTMARKPVKQRKVSSFGKNWSQCSRANITVNFFKCLQNCLIDKWWRCVLNHLKPSVNHKQQEIHLNGTGMLLDYFYINYVVTVVNFFAVFVNVLNKINMTVLIYLLPVKFEVSLNSQSKYRKSKKQNHMKKPISFTGHRPLLKTLLASFAFPVWLSSCQIFNINNRFLFWDILCCWWYIILGVTLV